MSCVLFCLYNPKNDLGQFSVRAWGGGGWFVEHIEYKTFQNPSQSAVAKHRWMRKDHWRLFKDWKISKTQSQFKMLQLILQVFILCGWAAQILEGSPMAGADLQETQIVSQQITPEQLRSLQVITINIIIIISVLIIIMSGIDSFIFVSHIQLWIWQFQAVNHVWLGITVC